MAKRSNKINLASLFKTVAGSLSEQRGTLNAADEYNHNHGDNMVEIFTVISKAMQTKINASPADQLEYASQLLREKSSSGSAQVYAQGLSQASKEFQGAKQITRDNALTLIQSLLGGGQSSDSQAQGSLGNLIGSISGAGTSQQSQAGPGDLLGTLLGGSTGGTSQNQSEDAGVDLGDLLNAGMAFMNTKSKGGTNLEAIVNAVVSSSAMGNSGHRAQSGTLVVNTLMQAIGGFTGKK